MTRSAIASCRAASAFALLACAAAPAAAQRNVTENRVGAADIALTPVEDLNLRNEPIPAVLVRARAGLYAHAGITDCDDIRREIGDLDAVLGDDYDSAPPDKREMSAGKIAQRLVASLIPYRGVIRELSGAARHEWEFREAISAGLMRRAYLKGLGQAMDCPYPARPMPAELLASLAAPQEGTAGEPVQVVAPALLAGED